MRIKIYVLILGLIWGFSLAARSEEAEPYQVLTRDEVLKVTKAGAFDKYIAIPENREIWNNTFHPVENFLFGSVNSGPTPNEETVSKRTKEIFSGKDEVLKGRLIALEDEVDLRSVRHPDSPEINREDLVMLEAVKKNTPPHEPIPTIPKQKSAQKAQPEKTKQSFLHRMVARFSRKKPVPPTEPVPSVQTANRSAAK